MNDGEFKKKVIVYIPPDADPNFTNQPSEPPRTKYERRKYSLNRREVKDLTKGKYGREQDD
jgi:hypothetical protein